MSIRLRLTLWYTLMLSVTVGVFALAFYLVLARTLRQEVDQTLALRAAQVRGVVRPIVERDGLDAITAQDLARAPLEELTTPGVYVEVLDTGGARLAASDDLPGGLLGGLERLEPVLGGTPVTTTVRIAGDEPVRVYAEPLRIDGEIVGVIKVGESLAPLERTLAWARALLVAGSIAAAGSSLFLALALTQRALAPIARMTATARAVATTRDYSRRLAEPPYEDELAELAGTFNELIAQVERSLASQQQLLADTSHELRNPLMTVLGDLNLLRRDLPRDLRLESITEAEGEVERMRRLVADLLLLNQADAQHAIAHEPVDLQALLREAAQRAQRMAQGQRVVLGRNEPATVLGDRDRLLQLLLNLIENALRYTPAEGVVGLRLELEPAPHDLARPAQLRGRGGRRARQSSGPLAAVPQPAWARLSVSDTGIGIPAEHLPYLFDRFYRVDRQRTRAEGGSGLGLSIVKWIAEAHGGQVRASSRPGEGTTFEVLLPLLAT
jgi:signal transduction histidine kinase